MKLLSIIIVLLVALCVGLCDESDVYRKRYKRADNAKHLNYELGGREGCVYYCIAIKNWNSGKHSVNETSETCRCRDWKNEIHTYTYPRGKKMNVVCDPQCSGELPKP